MTETSLPAARPAPRRGATTGILLSVLGSVVAGVIVSWWITVVQRVPVQSDAELESVRFGFPLPWITQDHSSNPFVAYPNDVELRLTGRTGIPYPTDYAWLPFIGDALIWGAVIWVVGMLALPAGIRALRASLGVGRRTSRRAEERD